MKFSGTLYKELSSAPKQIEMPANNHKLDNPVWFSLSETHQDFALSYDNLKCYDPDYCLFGGHISNLSITDAITRYSGLTDNFFIIGDKPAYPSHLTLKNELVCNQMVIQDKIDLDIAENIIQLTTQHSQELFQLVTLVQPGYFKNRTRELGNYFGIFRNDKLVAVAGERMKMNGYTEVSAVVTHPAHTGKGYARQLVAHTVNSIFNQNKIPYLHVAESNTRAIALYEQLGFTLRRKISFWHFVQEK